jgi:hypothetical protein
MTSQQGLNLAGVETVLRMEDGKITDKLIVLPDTDYDKDEAQAIIGRLSKISEGILERLYNAGVDIILVNGPITDVPAYAYLKGITPRGWEGTGKTWDDIPGAGGNPTVIRIGYSEYGKGHGSINLELHETAHAIDEYAFNNVSDTNNFLNVWSSEVRNVFGDNAYFDSYPEEYFAETFAMYYLDDESRNILKEKGPLTYDFIENLINSVSGVEIDEGSKYIFDSAA